MTYVPAVKGMSRVEIERKAEDFLRSGFPHHLTTPGQLDVIEVWEQLQDNHGLYAYVDELPEGIEGRTWPDGRVVLSSTTYTAAVKGDPRARFTVMHEVWHGLVHSHQIRNVLESGRTLTLNRRRDVPAYADPEWQANGLAAASLMPRPALQALRNQGFHMTPDILMSKFGVSYSAACIRLGRQNG